MVSAKNGAPLWIFLGGSMRGKNCQLLLGFVAPPPAGAAKALLAELQADFEARLAAEKAEKAEAEDADPEVVEEAPSPICGVWGGGGGGGRGGQRGGGFPIEARNKCCGAKGGRGSALSQGAGDVLYESIG